MVVDADPEVPTRGLEAPEPDAATMPNIFILAEQDYDFDLNEFYIDELLLTECFRTTFGKAPIVPVAPRGLPLCDQCLAKKESEATAERSAPHQVTGSLPVSMSEEQEPSKKRPRRDDKLESTEKKSKKGKNDHSTRKCCEHPRRLRAIMAAKLYQTMLFTDRPPPSHPLIAGLALGSIARLRTCVACDRDERSRCTWNAGLDRLEEIAKEESIERLQTTFYDALHEQLQSELAEVRVPCPQASAGLAQRVPSGPKAPITPNP